MWIWLVDWAVGSTGSGFVSPSRDDAPTDGAILFVDISGLFAEATDGNGVFPLDERFVTSYDEGPGFSKCLPPPGGWQAGQAYTVSLYFDGGDYGGPDDFVDAVTFTAAESSVSPHRVEVTATRVGAWAEHATAPIGCCYPVRTIEVDLTADDADVWAWSALAPRELDGATIFDNEPYDDLAVGPGSVTLTAVQWLDPVLGIRPPCFAAVGVSPAGVEGTGEMLCPDEVGSDAEVSDTPRERGSDASCSGCASVGDARFGWCGLAALAAVRLRRTPRRSAFAARSDAR